MAGTDLPPGCDGAEGGIRTLAALFTRPTPLAGESLRPLGYFCKYMGKYMAERVGFEPTDAFTSPVFKTGAFNHSATSPKKPPQQTMFGCYCGGPFFLSSFSFSLNYYCLSSWQARWQGKKKGVSKGVRGRNSPKFEFLNTQVLQKLYLTLRVTIREMNIT